MTRHRDRPDSYLRADNAMEVLTEHPLGGEFVFVRLSASDPDATPISIHAEWVPLEPDHAPAPGTCYQHGVKEGFGPWTPPAPRPGTLESVERLRAPDEGGTWRIIGCFSSTAWEYEPAEHWCPGDPSSWAFEGFTCRDPYGDFATPIIDVEVASPARPAVRSCGATHQQRPTRRLDGTSAS
jgi:hypothetical protein